MEEKIKVIEKNGVSFTATCHDPYGFWTIRLSKPGGVPKEFQGNFTSVFEVHRQIDRYLSRKAIEDSKLTLEQKRQAKTFPKDMIAE